MLERLLTRHDYAVCTARTYAEAMAAANSRRIDLLISDVGLPDRSGLELMQDLRAHGNVKGIALSGFTDHKDASASTDAGFDRHLNKPVIFEDLLAAIREITGWHPAAAERLSRSDWTESN